MMRCAIAVCMFALCMLAAVPHTAAQNRERSSIIFVPAPGEPMNTVEHGYWVYEMGAGGREIGTILLQNPSSKTVTLELQAIDAETAQAGGVTFADPTMPVRATGRWITLSQSRVTLGPNRERTVQFTVDVPQGIRPAQYLGGIAATVLPDPYPHQVHLPLIIQRPADPTNPSRTVQTILNVHSRMVLAVEVDIMGDWRSAMAISDVTFARLGSSVQARIDLRNTGDTFLRPSGTLTLTDTQGRRVHQADLMMGLFVAHTPTTYVVPNLPVGTGPYTADVVMHYGAGKVATYRNTVALASQNADPNTTFIEDARANLSPIVVLMYRVFTSWFQP